jgi:hypothetical protein
VERRHFKLKKRLVQASHATALEGVAKQIPAMLRVRPELAPVEKHVALIGLQFH